jgi:general L-amino acid transport system substrate-binding protein
MFERSLGAGSPLKLERGLNAQWNQGGLLYAPPFN